MQVQSPGSTLLGGRSMVCLTNVRDEPCLRALFMRERDLFQAYVRARAVG